MYCYTYAMNFECVLNELILWSDVSSEHPIFIKTVADLTNKKLPLDLINELNEINKNFTDIKTRTEKLREDIKTNPYQYQRHMQMLRRLINDFLIHDRHVLDVLPRIMQIGKADKVWQTLLQHITEEQDFMYKLFVNLRRQLG